MLIDPASRRPTRRLGDGVQVLEGGEIVKIDVCVAVCVEERTIDRRSWSGELFGERSVVIGCYDLGGVANQGVEAQPMTVKENSARRILERECLDIVAPRRST